MVPGPPSAIIAAFAARSNTITVRYLPPTDTGGGDSSSVALTSFRVELSTSPNFTRIDYSAESGDGAVWVQNIRAPKGRAYFLRVAAANAMGFGPPTTYSSNGSAVAIRSLSAPGPPSDITAVEIAPGDGALSVTYRPPTDTG